MQLLPLLTLSSAVVSLSYSDTSPSRIGSGENTLGAILFFSYIIAALYFTIYIVLSISRPHGQNQLSSDSSHGRHSSHDRKGSRQTHQLRHRGAYQAFCTLAFISFVTLSWNMLSFLVVSYLGWASAHCVSTAPNLKSRDDIRSYLHHIWMWATSSRLFQTFAEDLISNPVQWKTVRAALIYSYTWNSWMSALGCTANVPNLWTYFVLDQILPVSFAQNLFCVAWIRTVNVDQDNRKTVSDQYFILCLRLAGLWCYLCVLHQIPSTIDTARFLPSLFAVRVLLFTPYLVDRLASRLCQPTNPHSSSTTEMFNKCLVAISSIAVAHANFSGPQTYEGNGITSSGTNFAAAALSNDMVIGFLSGVASFTLFPRHNIWPR